MAHWRLWQGLLLLCIVSGCASPGIYHKVQPGESLRQIARAYGRSEEQLARVNGIDAPQSLRSGERLFIPGAAAARQLAPAPPPSRAVLPSVPSPPEQKYVMHAPRTAAAPLPMTVAATPLPGVPPRGKETTRYAPGASGKKAAPKAEPGRFGWPLRGTILRRYGDPHPFPCKGVEIAAPAGTAIRAAAAGRVIYSGDGISSFGNMIILRHDGDFYTVYAFARQNLVKTGSFVSRGDEIAFSGQPPKGGAPRLYFEVRRHQEPVDPTFYLP